jgi:hypothetical protein
MTVRGDEVDAIARIASAWDCRGSWVLAPPTEHQALLRLAGLPADLWNTPWARLSPDDRRKLIWTCRRVFEMARVCAWAFGAEQ